MGNARGAAAILLTSELRRRGRVHAGLAAAAVVVVALVVILQGAVSGVEQAIGAEVSAVLVVDARIAAGSASEVADGRFLSDADAVAGRLAQRTGAHVAPRIEEHGLFLHTGEYEDFDAGFLIGVDPTRDPGLDDLARRLASGRVLDGAEVWIDGRPYAQLVVGEAMREALGMEVYEGSLAPTMLLNVSAGRLASEGSDVRPVVRQGVVVGTFHTGLQPLDRHLVILHLDVARELLRMRFDPSAANLLVAGLPPGADVHAAARAEGLNATTAHEFQRAYLGGLFAPVRAFAQLVTGLVLVAAGGWATTVVARSVRGDAHRVAVLRAVGLPTRLVLAPVLAVVLAAGAVGALAGGAVGWAASRLISAGDLRLPGDLALPLVVAPTGDAVAATVVAMVALSALVGAVAGALLLRAPLARALRG